MKCKVPEKKLMYYVFVKHYLNHQGIEFFHKKWFPEVQEAIKTQPGFIDIISKKDSQNPALVHIILRFENQTTLLAWAATKCHDELVDNLDDYRVQSWEFAATDVINREHIDSSSELLQWQFVTPKTIAYS